MFIDREKEKEFLIERLKSDRSELIIVYGRRRVGKTYLLENVVKDGIFFTADLSSSFQLINRFFEDIKPLLDLPPTLEIKSWEEFFSFLSRVIDRGKKIIVIDEFQYIPQRDRSFLSVFQRWWDKIFSKKNVKFILCGSSIGMIEKIALSQSSPIYGRRTAQYEISPMDFEEAIEFLNFVSHEDYLNAYATVGGVPLYLLELSGFRNFYDAVREKILTPGSFLLEEGRFLTLEEFKKDPSSYFSILQAIANGKTSANEISNASGVEQRAIGTYLSRLLQLGFIKREYPFSLKKPRRRPLYEIDDEYLRFYFRYLHGQQELVYRGLSEYLLKRIKDTFPMHASLTFEKVSKQYLLKKEGIEKVGRWWDREVEIDIVGIREDELIVGECKWTGKKVGKDVLFKLKEKTLRVLRDLEISPKRIVYYLFSKSGFKDLRETDDLRLITLNDMVNVSNR